MAALKVVLLAMVLLGLIVLISCNDSNEDEKRPNATSGTAQSANQKPGEKPEADEGEEGEEGPATPAAVAAEKAAPQQTAGKQLAYNFDGDRPGQLPAQFHSAKTGGGGTGEMGGHRRSNRTLKTERCRPDFNRPNRLSFSSADRR